jgi:hypothetical protein
MVALLAWAGDVFAAELSAAANLSQRVAGVGENLRFEIKVNGARQLPAAPEVQADGLDIRYVGPSRSSVMRFSNGISQSETSVTFIYQVVPQRAGSFTIPAIDLAVDGVQLKTQPVGLTAEPRTGQGNGGREEIARAEIVVPKNTAYVGEAIPIELRLMIDARIRSGTNSKPDLHGEGFTIHDIVAPREEQQQIDGREYKVLIYRTAVTPSKAGKLTLGPAEIAFVARVPRAQRNRQRSIFDLFDDDVFGDPFFAANQAFKAQTRPVEIEVKPLPAAGRPDDFSGAVGQFTLSAEGSPRQVNIGDPVTMKLTVRGRGNFNRMGAPLLSDPTGWRAYPPSQEFKPDDEVGISGAKTFSVAVIPEVKKSAMPQFSFSYFDPVAAKYVSLQSKSAPLAVTGVERSAPNPAPPSADQRADAPIAAEAKPPAAANDILGLRYDHGQVRESFEPIYARRGFWLAQLVPLGILLALVGVRFLRVDPETRRKHEWKLERARLQARLGHSAPGSPAFLDDAARLLQLEAAASSGRDPASIDAAAAIGARWLDEETAREIEAIFDARGELLYAGGGGTDGSGTTMTRERVLQVIERYRQSHANS